MARVHGVFIEARIPKVSDRRVQGMRVIRVRAGRKLDSGSFWGRGLDHGIRGTGCGRQHDPLRRRQALLWLASLTGPLVPDRGRRPVLPQRRQSARDRLPARLHVLVRAARRRDLRRGHAQSAGGSRAGDVAGQLLPRAAVCRDRAAVRAVLRRRVVHRHALVAVVVVPRADARRGFSSAARCSSGTSSATSRAAPIASPRRS